MFLSSGQIYLSVSIRDLNNNMESLSDIDSQGSAWECWIFSYQLKYRSFLCYKLIWSWVSISLYFSCHVFLRFCITSTVFLSLISQTVSSTVGRFPKNFSLSEDLTISRNNPVVSLEHRIMFFSDLFTRHQVHSFWQVGYLQVKFMLYWGKVWTPQLQQFS